MNKIECHFQRTGHVPEFQAGSMELIVPQMNWRIRSRARGIQQRRPSNSAYRVLRNTVQCIARHWAIIFVREFLMLPNGWQNRSRSWMVLFVNGTFLAAIKFNDIRWPCPYIHTTQWLAGWSVGGKSGAVRPRITYSLNAANGTLQVSSSSMGHSTPGSNELIFELLSQSIFWVKCRHPYLSFFHRSLHVRCTLFSLQIVEIK